jgi:hypothetical protein
MINFVPLDVFISIIALELTRNDLGIGLSGYIISPHLKSSMEFCKYGERIARIRQFMRSLRAASAVGVEIWEQERKIAMVAPVHCAGWLPSQVHEYLRQVLEVLGAEYGFKKFASQVLISPEQCEIHSCPLKH